MKNNVFKKFLFIPTVIAVSITTMSSCVTANSNTTKNSNAVNNTNTKSTATKDDTTAMLSDLEVRFGDNGDSFALHLYDNETAKQIAKYVGTADWRLPIYHYDDYENYEVMQYYDIPSRYKITSNPQKVTSEKAGEVYYSEPNRIVLFYQDAEVSAEYTKIGYFDYSDEFVEAVENNPVLEGWGNKIVIIGSIDDENN